MSGDDDLAAGDLGRADVVAFNMVGDAFKPSGVEPGPLRLRVH
jgi:hypothetical protein